MRFFVKCISVLLIFIFVLSILPVASLAAENDLSAEPEYTETVAETEEIPEAAEEEAPEVPEEAPDVPEETAPDVADETEVPEETVPVDIEETETEADSENDISSEIPISEEIPEESGDADEEYVLLSDTTTEAMFAAAPANSKYVECAGITKAQFYADSAWKNIDPANSANKMEFVKLETNYAYFYLEYRVRTSAYEWCGPAYSNQWGTSAGKSGAAIANLEIKVYNCTKNAYDYSDYVVMYRAKVAGEWLDWVSNGSEAVMNSIKSDFGLSGNIDAGATDSGWLSRGNITALQVMMFVRRTRIAGSDAKIIKAPYINQFGAGLPNGCESASAVMALKYVGVNIDTETFVSKYLPMGTAPSGGVGSDPDKVYVGDPHKTGGLGWGCNAPVIEAALKKAADQSKYFVVNETGKALSAICTEYINNNVPVIVWATVDMTSSVTYSYWTTPEGKSIKYNNMLHCLLLVGYDSAYYYFNDPMNRVGVNDYFAYPKSAVESAYSLLGKQAVVIRKIACTGITLKSLPSKLLYYKGDSFDKAGLVVNASYNNGTNKNVTGYTVAGADTLSAGQKTVTVTWNDPLGGSFSKTFVITVVDPTPVLVSLAAVSLPEKTTYFVGEEFETEGLAVEGTYVKKIISNGTVKDETYTSAIPARDLVISGFDSTEEGTCTVTVGYGGLSASFEIEVVKRVTALKGDADGNGDVNMKDVLLCRKIIAGAEGDGAVVFENADMNDDGDINMKDILAIRKMIAGAE